MTVGDLIHRLQKIDPNESVKIEAVWGYEELEHIYTDTVTGAAALTPYGNSRLQEVK